MKRRVGLFLILVSLADIANAKLPEITITIKDSLFHPSVVLVPANKKVRLVIINEDEDPEEFDSFALNREKVIFGNSKASVYIGPLDPGRYPFTGQYHPDTAQGEVLVLDSKKGESDAN